ncbi:unnamed protein product [Prorocentrum cordatum]|uniref:hydroxymethylbilane synthase n=2 Tax=Prorocentrum cordatum TaxID=2364126 RepID=A0ABN9SQH5_9DINO|nr:unnamed protein product [Polarella glacialis]
MRTPSLARGERKGRRPRRCQGGPAPIQGIRADFQRFMCMPFFVLENVTTSATYWSEGAEGGETVTARGSRICFPQGPLSSCQGSPLALAQAYEAKRRLGEKFPELAPDEAVEIRIISTTGDQRLEISLSEIGGKGLFTRELDVALASKEVDFCVHSTKDVPTDLIPDTELCTMLPREDTRDCFISGNPDCTRIADLPDGSVIGTASLRRQSQIYSVNPTLRCVNFRGNVQTRLRKLKGGDVDATLLAYAGLKRMDMTQHATSVLEWDEMLPAIAQGAISFQCRSDDQRVLDYLRPLSHEQTFQSVTCERAFLAALDGNCKTPIAGQARVEDGQLLFKGLVASPDGQKIFRVERAGSPSDATEIGRDAGAEVRKEAGEKFFEDMQDYVQEVQAANTKPTKAPASA